jgi:hypothetical protein
VNKQLTATNGPNLFYFFFLINMKTPPSPSVSVECDRQIQLSASIKELVAWKEMKALPGSFWLNHVVKLIN